MTVLFLTSLVLSCVGLVVTAAVFLYATLLYCRRRRSEQHEPQQSSNDTGPQQNTTVADNEVLPTARDEEQVDERLLAGIVLKTTTLTEEEDDNENILRIADFGESNELVAVDESCVICLVDYRHGDSVLRSSACEHVFHKKCIAEWIETGNRACPCCRTEIPLAGITEPEDLESGAPIQNVEAPELDWRNMSVEDIHDTLHVGQINEEIECADEDVGIIETENAEMLAKKRRKEHVRRILDTTVGYCILYTRCVV